MEKPPQTPEEKKLSRDADKVLKRMDGKCIRELKMSLRGQHASERYLALAAILDSKEIDDEARLKIIQENKHLLIDFDSDIRLQMINFLKRLRAEQLENPLVQELIEIMKKVINPKIFEE